MSEIILKPGLEKAIGSHPWIFSGAISEIKGNPGSGETVNVYTFNGEFFGYAAFSPESQIRVRIWNHSQQQKITEDYIRHIIETAINNRQDYIKRTNSNAVRLVYSESDNFPGLIVDRYDDVLVLQVLSAGADFWRKTVIDILNNLLHPVAIIERSEAEVVKKEGLLPRSAVHSGTMDKPVSIEENGIRYEVNPMLGHKTGFYLDQRENRFKIRSYTHGKEVLDAYCYTGGFTLNVLSNGASKVTSVDSSEYALEILKNNIEINNLDNNSCEIIQADVPLQLRKFRDAARQFDAIILDPPKFAPTRSSLQKAIKAYKDINLLAMKLLRPGGYLMTFSCSGAVSLETLQEVIGYAQADCGKTVKIVEVLGQPEDHPILITFPESEYLKGYILRVD